MPSGTPWLIEKWGCGYYRAGERGTVEVTPEGAGSDGVIDLHRLVTELVERGIQPPILLRFGGILRHRMHALNKAFQTAIDANGYRGTYTAIYPIKVNQQRQVVEEIQRHGLAFGRHFGLEAGSKAELLCVLAITDDETPIICNGFKDAEYLEMAVLAHKISKNIVPVIEREEELDLVLEAALKHQVSPAIGLRIKLATRGAGPWAESAGQSSKFGLTTVQALAVLERLREVDRLDCLKLLHYHMGSQITDIRQVQRAVAEVTRVYTELVGMGAPLEFLDVGGGLGVDYDGSQTAVDSSINYTLQEYANDVVYHVKSVCDEAQVAHPVLMTESGRALTAHHSVLVFNVLGVSKRGRVTVPETLPADADPPLHRLHAVLREVTANRERETLRRALHDCEDAMDRAIDLFRLGHLTLEERALAESMRWQIEAHIAENSEGQRAESLSPEVVALMERSAQLYFGNFSVFQSLPDTWAIGQLFPVLPIHRLHEEPTVRAELADISCDSDGKLDRFIVRSGTGSSLPLHPLDEQPYYLGAFLVGAYQEILGDLHNLLGDTNAVHVGFSPSEGPVIEDVVEGDRVSEVLRYVQFDSEDLERRFRVAVEAAVRRGDVTARESGELLRFFSAGLEGYTYLEEP